jgi:hypothetical protein
MEHRGGEDLPFPVGPPPTCCLASLPDGVALRLLFVDWKGAEPDDDGRFPSHGCTIAEKPGGPVNELNPNHPVTVEFREQRHKLCAILMLNDQDTKG